MKPERLDKVLAAQSTWSRKDVKELIRKGQVTVNGLLAGIRWRWGGNR